MLDPIKVANSIIECAGQEFHTPTKHVPFTYSFNGPRIVISNTNYHINFGKNVKVACDILNAGGSRKEFRNKVQGPSYLRALLQDERIVSVQEVHKVSTSNVDVPEVPKTSTPNVGVWFTAELKAKGSHWTRNKVGSKFSVRKNGTHVEVVNERSTNPHSHIIDKDTAREYFTLLSKVA